MKFLLQICKPHTPHIRAYLCHTCIQLRKHPRPSTYSHFHRDTHARMPMCAPVACIHVLCSLLIDLIPIDHGDPRSVPAWFPACFTSKGWNCSAIPISQHLSQPGMPQHPILYIILKKHFEELQKQVTKPVVIRFELWLWASDLFFRSLSLLDCKKGTVRTSRGHESVRCHDVWASSLPFGSIWRCCLFVCLFWNGEYMWLVRNSKRNICE